MSHITAVGHELIRLVVCVLFAAVFIGCVVGFTDIIYTP